MRNSQVNMLSGSITRGLLSMTIPIMVMNVMQSLFNIIDMTTLRYFSNDSAVGAVGVCGTLITLCTSLLIGLSAGANVVVAKRIGSGNQERADRAVTTAILLSLTGGLILMGIGVLFAESFLKMANCPDSLLRQASVYFKIYFCGVPVMMLYNFLASILRATGDTKKPMYFLILGGFIKVILTIMLVTAFDMDVEGVALATILSNIVASILAFCALCKSRVVHIQFKRVRFDIKELKEIVFIGVPAGMQSALYSLANVVISAAVNSFGADATTGISIANQFDGILYQISYAPSLATIPYVAQNVGAGNIKRVKQTVLRAVWITTAFGATFGALSAIFSGQLSSIMSSTPAVIAYSRQKMVIISSTYFICGINEVMGGVLKGLGKPILPAIATLVFMCLIRFVWVYGIFPHCPTLTFLYLIWPIGWILSIITLLIAYFPAIASLDRQSNFLQQEESV
ncbi:MAG: MATE family efflux transporter [Ruminococcaceae bacterium]|nr:MATE family efflux transporter [Oscillospiraceae bacterium]